MKNVSTAATGEIGEFAGQRLTVGLLNVSVVPVQMSLLVGVWWRIDWFRLDLVLVVIELAMQVQAVTVIAALT